MKRSPLVVPYACAVLLLLAVDAALTFSGFARPEANRALAFAILAILHAALVSGLFFVAERYAKEKMGRIKASIEGISTGAGDLTRRIELKRDPAAKPLAKALNIFLSRIHNTILKMKIVNGTNKGTSLRLETSVSEISSATEEISANAGSMKANEETLNGGIDTTNRAVEDILEAIRVVLERIGVQSEALAKSRQAIEEMISSIDGISGIASTRGELMEQLELKSEEGSKNMKSSLAAITRISDSVGTINDFTRIINSIASQTNLLAMNAAIEAAHAGEFGKGFGVVADEIRKLAETTSKNSRSISESLSGMVSHIDQALALTTKADKSIGSVNESIKDVAQGVGEIVVGLGGIGKGTQKVTDSLGSLAEASDSVQSAASRISAESERIGRSMKEVSNLSEENMRGIGEISEGIGDLVRSMAMIKELGEENKKNIGIMDEDLRGFVTIDTSKLKSEDGQDLVIWAEERRTVPPRPASPENFSEDDSRRWYDFEYAGWNTKKERLPESDAEGARGKRVIAINPAYHDYYKAHSRGMRRLADYFALALETYPLPKKDAEKIQAEQVETAVASKPDLIVFAAADVSSSAKLVKRIHDAGIPVIAATNLPSAEALKFVLGYTGTDEWGSFRLLARRLALALDKKGGYGIIQHIPGCGPYYDRTYAPLTELKTFAPGMSCLERAYTEFDRAKTKAVVVEWERKHGKELRGIISADQAGALEGIVDALDECGRKDIIVVAQGHCRVSLDLVKSGKVFATTYQPAESDGALPIAMAVDYFNGIEFTPIKYLPNKLITKENVEEFYPAQW